jgi:hypothetical protein
MVTLLRQVISVLIKNHTIKIYGVEVASRLGISSKTHAPGALLLEKEPLVNLDRGWWDPSACLEIVETREINQSSGI